MELGGAFSPTWRSGFSVAVSLQNLFWCLIGAIIGTAIGVLPGVGPVATMALLLPVTYFLPAEGALIMLAGIYYGAQYGGSTTAILVNLPGESSSVVTCLDGYQMARQGRAGPALAIAAHRLLLCRLRRHHRDRGRRAAADEAGPAVRAGRLLLADGARPGLRHRAGARLGASRRSAWSSSACCWGSSAPTSTPATCATPSASAICSTASASCRWRWACSASPRSWPTSPTPERRDLVSSKVSGLMPTREDLSARSRRSCAARSWAGCSASCPAAARCWPRSPPTRWRRSSRARRRNSAPA